MYAVVSLFDEPTTEAVKNVWTELANDFGVRHLSDVLPYPHFSYQIAQQYEEQELVGHVEDLAQQATPFQIQSLASLWQDGNGPQKGRYGADRLFVLGNRH